MLFFSPFALLLPYFQSSYNCLLFIFRFTHSCSWLSFSHFPPLAAAMHLFGLNWQLQESEGYGAFENGGVGRDTTPNTFIVSTDNGESLLKKQN